MLRPSFVVGALLGAFFLTTACDSRAKEELALARAQLRQTQAALEACQATAAADEADDDTAPEEVELEEERVEEAPAPTGEPPPIVPVRTRVRANSAGTPELELWVRNDSEKTIDAFRFNAFCQNNFGEHVTSRIRNHPFFRGSNQAERDRERLRPGAERKVPGHWSMFRFEGCTKARVVIDEVHFVDDTTWAGLSEQEDFPDSAI